MSRRKTPLLLHNKQKQKAAADNYLKFRDTIKSTYGDFPEILKADN